MFLSFSRNLKNESELAKYKREVMKLKTQLQQKPRLKMTTNDQIEAERMKTTRKDQIEDEMRPGKRMKIYSTDSILI